MCINKSNSGTGHQRRLDSAYKPGSHSSCGLGILSMHHTCMYTVLIKLAIVLLVVLEAGNVQGLVRDSKTVNSLGRVSRKNDVKHFTLYQHSDRQSPTHYGKQRYPHTTESNESSQRAIINSNYSSKVDTDSEIKQNLKVDDYECIITVVNETATINNSYCNCQPGTSLHALDKALNCTANQNTTVQLTLQSDHLTLHEVHRFEGHSGIHIIGKPTYIQCNSTQESGLSFNKSNNIKLENVTLSECGAKHKSTSVNFVNKLAIIYSPSAIYLSYCSDIALHNVAIKGTDGIGLTMVNCGGMVNITGSNFTDNSIKMNKSVPGGGGVSIELRRECSLPECKTNTVKDYSNAKYNIQDCRFINNNASAGRFLITHITSNNNYFTYGQGGGLSVNLGCLASGNVLNVSNSYFEFNNAQRGGGLFISFREHSKDTNISVNNVVFRNNTCYQAKLPPGGNYSSGGGMKVLYYTNSERNNIVIKGGNFINNTAYFGGALSMGGGADYDNDSKIHGKTSQCTFLIERSHFQRNNARIGAALDLYYRVSAKETDHGSSVLPTISNSNFTLNGGLYYYSNATGRTFATIYIVYIHVKFCGTINIVNNTASGFGIEEATVQFQTNALISLTNNTAKIGGGMALIGRSTVVVHKNTTVEFQSNWATEKGGAIFASQSQERYTAYDYTCFIKYESDATLTFSDNKADSSNYIKNDIYTSSLLPCVWPSSPTSELEDDIKETFCGWGNSWHFDLNCSSLIETAPSRFNRSRYNVSVILGSLTRIKDFRVHDDLGHDVSASALYTVSQISPPINQKYVPKITVTNEGILVKANEMYQNWNLTVVLQTADRKSITTELIVNILKCPPGFEVSDKQACECKDGYDFKKKVHCNNIAFISLIFAGYCITFSNIILPNKTRTETLIVARCPYVVGKFASLYNPVPPLTSELEDAFCSTMNRTGKLCGHCQENFGIDVYSINYQCIKCKHVHLNWIKVIAASTIPTTLLFTLCTVFHISITSASLNGYIFFSHVITMRLDELTVQYVWKHLGRDKDTLSNLLYFPYHLWTFDFPQILLNSTCLGEHFRVTHALALQYLNVLYPFLLVLTAIVLIELHAKNCKPLVWLWKPLCYLCVRFRHSWHIRTTVIDTFASFLLLSYSNLIGVSMSLLAPNSIILNNGTVVGHTLNYDTSVEFFRKTHLKFGILAIIILCTFGAIPPILLILYPFKWFQYLLNRCRLRGCHFIQVFVDAFQGSYKNNVKGYPERRYFAGVYFLFRIAIKLIYVLLEDMIELHLTLTLTYMFFMFILMAQRPYKKNFYNILDGVFMAVLVTTHAMTVYMFYHAMALNEVPKKVWYFTYSIQHIPTLYMILLVVYLVSFRMRCVKRFCLNHFGGRSLFFKNEAFNDKNSLKSPLVNYDWPSTSSLVIPSPSSPHAQTRCISDIPDRVENPHRYEPLMDSWQYSHKGSLQDFSEVVDSKKRKNVIGYGSNTN